MDFIINLYKYLDKEFTNELINSLDSKRTNSLILNTDKISEESFVSLFPLVRKHPYLKYVFYYDSSIYEFGKNYLMIAGCYYIMDASSLIATSLFNINDGDKILDMCAAPGGKTISLLLYNKDKTFEVISNDLSYNRSLELSKNIERIGASNIIVTNNDFHLIKNKYFKTFDKIILDAPCSGSAMFRKNDLAKSDWSIEKVLALKEIQKTLLEDAIFMLKDGGEIIYSTCSFSYEENEEVILETLNSHNEIELINIPNHPSFYKDKNLKEAIHLFPNLYEGEGQFICHLKKNGESINREKSKTKLKHFSYDRFNFEFNKELKINDTIYLTNNNLNLSSLKLIRPGLEVGVNLKNRFVPSFHLAHFLNSSDSIKLNEQEKNLYLHGDQINKKLNIKNGYYVVSFNGINLGFIKYIDGKLKNLYPKGLRH